MQGHPTCRLWINGLACAVWLVTSPFPRVLRAQTPLPEGPALMALWDFDAILPDGRVPDRGPSGLHGRVHGTWETVEAPAGKAVRFSGDTAFVVEAADGLDPGDAPLTVEVLVRPRVAAASMPFLSKWEADQGYRILWTPSGDPDHPVLHYRLHYHDGSVLYSAPGFVAVEPNFTHLLAVFDRDTSNAAVYREGQPVTVRHGSDNLDAVGRAANEAPLRIEAGFLGDVVRLALYRGPLEAEMAELLRSAARSGRMPGQELERHHETILATDGLRFDGRRDHIRVPHHPALNPEAGNWTVAFQIKLPEPVTRDDRIFLAKRDGDGGAGVSIGALFTVVCNEGREQSIDLRPHLSVHAWQDVAVQIDRQQDQLRAFVNGTLVAEQALVLSGALDAASDLVMGGNSTGRLNGHPCLLRAVRIWKEVLPAPRQPPGSMPWEPVYDAAGLVAHWPLREGAGRKAVQDVVGGRTGNIAGDPEWPVRMFDRDLAGQVVRAGQTVTLGPVVLHQPRGEVRHQWFFEGQPIDGATGGTLVLENIAPSSFGAYHVDVDDDRHMTPVPSRTVHVGEADWPMWQYDAARSADPPQELAGKLHLQWVRELPAPRRAWAAQQDDLGKLDFDVASSPVAAGGRLFVPSSVTDSVTAYRLEDGAELWRFYADGPVRLAPAVWRQQVFFVSDDGFLYCTDARSGEMLWKFRGGPSDHRLLGNERIINLWAARGGPVVKDGIVYFTAGIWPLHGIFIHALDAASGRVLWVNDTTGSEYVDLPHGGASGYGGLAPQGYLAATRDHLIVAGGRGTPAFLSRHTGEVVHFDSRGRFKGEGGYAVHGLDGGGIGRRHSTMLARAVQSLADPLEHEVFDALVAGDRLVITTVDGTLHGFGPEAPDEPVRHVHTPAAPALRSTGNAGLAATLLDAGVDTAGYGLVLGAGSGDLLRELLARTDLHLVVVERDPGIVRALRDDYADSGLHGRRVAVIETSPAAFSVQPYLFSLIVSEDAEAAGLDADAAGMAALLNWLRPYGGVAWLGASGTFLARMTEGAVAASVDQVVATPGEAHLLARRAGPLGGAGEWTHQHHDSANTLFSQDRLVRLPLGILWFGGPGNANVLPRWGLGPRPQVSGGRQVFLGVETIAARCVYTGRALWERAFPGIGHPYTRERGGPGVNVRWTAQGVYSVGSPFVTLPDAVYLSYDGRIHKLDPASGETIAAFSVPGRPVVELYDAALLRHIGIGTPDRGHVSVWGKFLVATAEPDLFEGQIPGQPQSYSGTSSRRLAVLDRFSGDVLWSRTARVGFRHHAIASGNGTLYVMDGLSENALQLRARRGQPPDEPSVLMALDLQTGEERWQTESEVFGTFLLYSEAHDLLIEGGTFGRHPLDDEIERNVARCGRTGTIRWTSGQFTLPAALRGDMLISGRRNEAHGAVSILTGEPWVRTLAEGAGTHPWRYTRQHGCSTLNASANLLLFRTAYAGFYDLEHETGTGNLSGFRSGCTANLLAADGVLNALDYTRTCTCGYGLQTSLALVHMPGDGNLEVWARHQGAPRNPAVFGINFGAPGRRADALSGRIWQDARGFLRRHASALTAGDALPWVASSGHEFIFEENDRVVLKPLADSEYRVRLTFAELDAGMRPGQRVFDVLLNGRPVLERFDIVEAAGGPLRGIVKTARVAPEEGGIVVTLRRSPGSAFFPLLNGLELTAEE